MKKYTLDQTGVAAWQQDLYQSSEHRQALEREYVQTDFEGWLVERFGAEQRQINYLATLGEDFVNLLRDELVLSMRELLPIEFDRQPKDTQTNPASGNASVRSGDSVKVTEIEKWLERRKEGEEEDEEPEGPEGPDFEKNGKMATNRHKRNESKFVVRTYYLQQ